MDQRFALTEDDDRYPEALRDERVRAEVLYVRGDPSVLEGRMVSVIGARRATPYGIAVAEMAGRIAAESGITVVSGGAMGCDYAASRAALDAGGRTVIVCGHGADQVYPASSADVFADAIAHDGAVVAIERWGVPPTRYTFPKRNVIIAALSPVLIVAEAGERSGTMGTVDAALELDRTIYAVPGSIFSPESVGANRLICEGAAPIVSEEDLEMRISLDFGAVRLMMPGQKRELGRILSALVSSPMRPDDLANRLGEPALSVLVALSDYEASGLVVRLPDGRYSPSRDCLLSR